MDALFLYKKLSISVNGLVTKKKRCLSHARTRKCMHTIAFFFHRGILKSEVPRNDAPVEENEDRKHEYLKYVMRFAQLPPKVAAKQYFVAQ